MKYLKAHMRPSSCLAQLYREDQRVLWEIAGFIAAFLRPRSLEDVVLGKLRERGRRRKQVIPKTVDALLKAAARYRDLAGLEIVDPGLAQRMEQEAIRLLLQLNREKVLHNEKRFGLTFNFLWLAIVADFVACWSERHGKPSQLTPAEMALLVTAGKAAVGWGAAYQETDTDDIRGLVHFRANPQNQDICELAGKFAYHVAAHLEQRPFLLFRDEI